METLLIVSIFIIGIGFLIKWITKYREFGIRLNENTGFKFLLGWIIFGFVARLDYSDAWGCIIGLEPILEPKNILFSTISFALIFRAFRAGNMKLKKTLLGIELLYWIAKLIIFKGGYVVGYGGIPDFTIVFYDLVAILARLFILSQILKVNQFKFAKIGMTALLVLGIKISIFATPMSMIYEERKAFEEAQEIRKELIGDWSGKVTKSEDEEIKFEENVNIRIDSTNIYLDSIGGLKRNYKLILEYPEYGLLSETGEYHDYSLSIQKRNKDSLIMRIDDVFKEYEFKLKKK